MQANTRRLPVPAAQLLATARRGLHDAATCARPCERYALAHLAALRCAAAVLAERARPEPLEQRRTRRLRSAWSLLADVAPELAEWAAFFAAGAVKRAAAEAGIEGAVTIREADDLLRDCEAFLALVETTIGHYHQGILSGSLSSPGADHRRLAGAAEGGAITPTAKAS